MQDKEFFAAAAFCRTDIMSALGLEEMPEWLAKLDDENMNHLAMHFQNALLECDYWDILRELAKQLREEHA